MRHLSCCLLAGLAIGGVLRLPAAKADDGEEPSPHNSEVAGEGFDARVLEALERLRPRGVNQTVSDCGQLIETGEELRVRIREASERGALQEVRALRQERNGLPWPVCVAAVRMMGESADEIWLPVLDDMFERWVGSAPSGIELGRSSIARSLESETAAAYALIAFGRLSGPDLIAAWRLGVIERDGLGVTTRANGVLFRRIQEELGWTPRVLALFQDPDPRVRRQVFASTGQRRWFGQEVAEARVGHLADSDPGIRRTARAVFTKNDHLRTLLVPAFLAFLSRSDIDSDARLAGEEALRIRGFVPISGPDGLMAVPLDPSRDEAILAPARQ